MRKYILKRILISIVILFFVGFIIYALMRCLPTSYIENMARQKSMQPNSKSYEEWMAQLTAMYNMDKGIIPGYFAWLGQAFRGEFGDSWFYTVPVLEKFNETVWLSFIMGGIVLIFEIIIAIPLGIVAATKQYSTSDYVISVIALAGISLPTFFFASLLKLVFSVKLGWFDLFGLVGRNYNLLSASGQFWDKAKHLVLPIVTLVVISIGGLMRYTRTNMLEVLNADYIRTARAKGLSETEVILKHGLRTAVAPILTQAMAEIPELVGSAAIVEKIFGWPGIGALMIEAIRNRDVPLIMGVTLVIAVVVLLANIFLDIAYGLLDPRVSYR